PAVARESAPPGYELAEMHVKNRDGTTSVFKATKQTDADFDKRIKTATENGGIVAAWSIHNKNTGDTQRIVNPDAIEAESAARAKGKSKDANPDPMEFTVSGYNGDGSQKF